MLEFYSSILWTIPIIFFFSILFWAKFQNKLLRIAKWSVVPLTIMFGVAAVAHDYKSQFMPTKSFPLANTEFLYNFHKVEWRGDNLDIMLWITTNNSPTKEYIFVFPYSKEAEEKLNGIAAEGAGQIIKFSYESGTAGGYGGTSYSDQSSNEEFDIAIIPHIPTVPKKE